MNRYILSINEHSKRGKLVKQLLNELKSKKEVLLMTLEEYEKAEEKILANEIKEGLKSSSYSLNEAKKELLKLRKKIA